MYQNYYGTHRRYISNSLALRDSTDYPAKRISGSIREALQIKSALKAAELTRDSERAGHLKTRLGQSSFVSSRSETLQSH